MQIVSTWDNLHEMSNLFSVKNKKNIINMSVAEFAMRVVKVKLESFCHHFANRDNFCRQESAILVFGDFKNCWLPF